MPSSNAEQSSVAIFVASIAASIRGDLPSSPTHASNLPRSSSSIACSTPSVLVKAARTRCNIVAQTAGERCRLQEVLRFFPPTGGFIRQIQISNWCFVETRRGKSVSIHSPRPYHTIHSNVIYAKSKKIFQYKIQFFN